ncbi:acylphosphatase [Alcanivorax sp. DP30]|uniref:acylphosphatase n=1 Tax=Alcanivorax sp. DP30 TaxID=2606217 RepID=UPI001371289F|nr:acylphosphatase [Alcanivorax sp. DP30]MZR61531.1 acylphosphatase [Alcanivorax sp. DP30]
MLTRHVLVTGMVQGVGYRAWTRQAALQRNLVGWVRNLADGRVEAVLQGEDDDVLDMLDAMRQGPAMARVEDLQSRAEEALVNNHFEVTG